MCKAFSCLVARDSTVTWKFGVDSHTDLVKLAGYKDDTADMKELTFARVEITPKNKSYLYPDEWVLIIDERIKPQWFGALSETVAFSAHKKWLAQLHKILISKKIVHPFELAPPSKISEEQISLLRKWDSVWDSVGASVGDSVRDSVWASVWGSVWDSVRDSVWGSVWAYAGSFFKLPTWKYVKHTKNRYPFGPCVQLWMLGLVPSFDGKTWRLHGGPKAAVLFSITAEELRKK